jgi:hypothetical protein
MTGRWVDVAEAARKLGLSTDAVRKRIARGSLESDRPDGSVLVWLDDGGTETGHEAQADGGPLVESLRDQVAYLREIVATRDEEIRRRDVIISQLTDRIPAIEAPSEPRESPTEATEQPGGEQRAAGTARKPTVEHRDPGGGGCSAVARYSTSAWPLRTCLALLGEKQPVFRADGFWKLRHGNSRWLKLRLLQVPYASPTGIAALPTAPAQQSVASFVFHRVGRIPPRCDPCRPALPAAMNKTTGRMAAKISVCIPYGTPST